MRIEGRAARLFLRAETWFRQRIRGFRGCRWMVTWFSVTISCRFYHILMRNIAGKSAKISKVLIHLQEATNLTTQDWQPSTHTPTPNYYFPAVGLYYFEIGIPAEHGQRFFRLVSP